MKKASLVCCLALLLTFFSTAVCFADGGTFTITSTYPVNNQEDTSLDNLCVKIYLDSNANFENTLDSQKSKFKIVDASGEKEIPFGLKYDSKENFILLFAYNAESKTTLASDVGVENDAQYKAIISKDLVDDNGKVLQVNKDNADQDGNYTLTFRTQNMSQTMTINMVMMGVMFVGILFFSARAAKKSKEEEDAKTSKVEKINPYEEAKRTGKSVEQILAKQEKKRQKAAKKEEQIRLQKEKEEAEIQAILAEEIKASYYHVKEPKPIAAVGGKYKSGRKAKAEAEAKKAEKKAKANAKKGKGKGKGKK